MSDDLRDLLHAVVPDPPAAPDRASGARERHRRQRRRTTIGVAAAAAVVVAALAVVPAVLSGESDDTEPAPVPTHGCPAPDAPADGPSKLPDDPVSVRLCPGTRADFDAPEDLVVGADAQTLVALANTQPLAEDDATCGSGRDYLLVFTYPDGHAQVVSAPGCGYLRIGSSLHEDGDATVAKLMQKLHDQRQAADPPAGLAVRPGCDVRQEETSPLEALYPMAVATLCAPGSVVEIPVASEDLQVLLDDVRPEDYAEPIAPGLRGLVMVGTSAWGDTERFTVGTDWWPGPEAQEILGRLLAEAGTPNATIDASSTPAEVVAAYVGRLNAGDDAAASALWMSQVPVPGVATDDVHIGVEVRRVQPVRTISAWRDATAVTTRYREVRRDGSDVDEREAVFLLGRDEQGDLRIVNLQIKRAAPDR